MKFTKAKRSACKIKLSVAGPSGSGKTYSSLLMAQGLVNDWSKIGVVDTENSSASLYSHLGDFDVLSLSAPFTPEKYVQAIKVAEQSGYQCVIIDSLSHCWEGEGGILQTHAHMAGNSFTNWSKLTPMYNRLLQAIQQCSIHVIVTLRSKQEYAVNTVNGKSVPEKLGLKPIARDGIDYEFSIAFDLNQYHQASVSKDRTGLFKNEVGLKLDQTIGRKIKVWCMIDDQPSTTSMKVVGEDAEEILSDIDPPVSDAEVDSVIEHILATTREIIDPIARLILDAESIEELQKIYENTPEIQDAQIYRRLCTRRKQELLTSKISLNGVSSKH